MRQFLLLTVVYFITQTALLADSLTGTPATNAVKPINIGMSVSLTGQNSATGQSIREGVQMYFNKINSLGGVQGHRLQLIAKDDGYKPERAIQNIRELITSDQVIAIVGNNGSASANAAVPIVNAEKVLLFGAYPGTAVLHKTPPDRYVINLRVSYKLEVSTMIKGLLSTGIKPDQFAFLTQDDQFGTTVYQSAIQTLSNEGYVNAPSLPSAQYPRNTVNVEDAIAKILSNQNKTIRAFILGGTVLPNEKIIKLAHPLFGKAYFVAFAGLMEADQINNTANRKVLLSEAVPYYKNSNLPAIREYLSDIKKYGSQDAKPNIISFQAYLTAKLFVMGLKQAALNKHLTREGIIDSFESMNDVDIGIGIKIHFDKNDHQALNTVWPTIYENGDFVPLKWSELTIQ